MASITARALNRATLARQGLLDPLTTSAAEAVDRLGSLQAQHPEWPPVALAARAAGAATADLAGALERRAVVRSSLMRLTIHVVAAGDLWPMFAVCQPLRLNQWRLLMKADPRTSALGKRMMAAHPAAIAALRERPRSSLEIDRIISEEVGPGATSVSRPAGRDSDARVVVRASWRHFSAFLPLVHVPHDGEGYGRSRYALATDWLGEQRPEVDEGDARTYLARRYLAAFGPASVEDLIAYVGRGKAGVVAAWRHALTALGDEVVTMNDESGRTLYDLEHAPRPPADTHASPRLIARWDSLLLSHATRHRGRVISDEHRPRVFSKNADVLPTILVDGTVSGTWELLRRDGRADITLRPFRRMVGRNRAGLEAEAYRILALIAPDHTDHIVTFAA